METKANQSFPLSAAPMMGCTDRHFRCLMRGITRRTLLYSEMVPAGAVLRSKASLLEFSQMEKPLVLQLAGSKPKELAICARIAEDMGYDQVNLNVGCPSSRAEAGNFGACLMKSPEKTAACFAEMQAACSIPVTIKHRLGIGFESGYGELLHFVQETAQAGCIQYIVHARSALLSGISPEKNRKIPPLCYESVYRLAEEAPSLRFELNGGIQSLEKAKSLLSGRQAKKGVPSGIMIGRAAYADPYMFHLADRLFYDSQEPPPTRLDVLQNLEEYLGQWPKKADRIRILRHSLNFFTGIPGARFWRRCLSTPGEWEKSPASLLKRARQKIPQAELNASL